MISEERFIEAASSPNEIIVDCLCDDCKFDDGETVCKETGMNCGDSFCKVGFCEKMDCKSFEAK